MSPQKCNFIRVIIAHTKSHLFQEGHASAVHSALCPNQIVYIRLREANLPIYLRFLRRRKSPFSFRSSRFICSIWAVRFGWDKPDFSRAKSMPQIGKPLLHFIVVDSDRKGLFGAYHNDQFLCPGNRRVN